MKITTKLLLLLVTTSLNFGCKKYPDNPEFKGYLKSATSLIVGNQYKVNSFWVDGIDSTANFRQYSYYDAIVYFKEGKGGRLDNRVILMNNPDHPLPQNYSYLNGDVATWVIKNKKINMTDGFVSNTVKLISAGIVGVGIGTGTHDYNILKVYKNDFWVQIVFNNKKYVIKFIKIS